MFREQDGPSPCGFPLFIKQLAPIKKILISRCDISHGNGHKSLAHVKLASVLCVWVIKFLCDYAPFHFGLFLGSAIKARRPVWENSSLFWFLSFLLALLSPHISHFPLLASSNIQCGGAWVTLPGETETLCLSVLPRLNVCGSLNKQKKNWMQLFE